MRASKCVRRMKRLFPLAWSQATNTGIAHARCGHGKARAATGTRDESRRYPPKTPHRRQKPSTPKKADCKEQDAHFTTGQTLKKGHIEAPGRAREPIPRPGAKTR